MAHKKKLVVCLSRFPYPLDKGDKLRAFHQIKQLAISFEVYLICTTDTAVNSTQINVLKEFCKEVFVFKLSPWKIGWNLFLTIFSTKPFQVAYFYQFSIHRKIKTLLSEIKPDFIYSQLIRTSEYVKNYHACSKTLDYMDAFSKGIERRMSSKKGIIRWVFKQEFQRLLNYERQIFEYFEHHTIISEQDRSFIAHPRQKEIFIIPNGVAHFTPEKYKPIKNIDLLFTGNMGYPPNVEAALFIYQKVLPYLSDTTTCLIAGVNPPISLKKLASETFRVSGWVEDMGECYAKSKIFIAPMFIGTGLQNKLLEAMAMGIPCITTTLANKALKATPNKEILIANSPAEFISQITNLQEDKTLYNRIAEQGKNYVRSNFSWEKCNDLLRDLIPN
jgi:glycosyltransferase involved in cell wall biosynthesis